MHSFFFLLKSANLKSKNPRKVLICCFMTTYENMIDLDVCLYILFIYLSFNTSKGLKYLTIFLAPDSVN